MKLTNTWSGDVQADHCYLCNCYQGTRCSCYLWPVSQHRSQDIHIQWSSPHMQVLTHQITNFMITDWQLTISSGRIPSIWWTGVSAVAPFFGTLNCQIMKVLILVNKLTTFLSYFTTFTWNVIVELINFGGTPRSCVIIRGAAGECLTLVDEGELTNSTCQEWWIKNV